MQAEAQSRNDINRPSRSALLQAILAVRIWLIPTVLLFLLKYLTLGDFIGLTSGGGFLEVSRIWGVQLTSWQRFAFFREDILVNLVLIPCLLVALVRILPKRLGNVLLAVLTVSASVFILIQAKSYLWVGQFLSYSAMRDAVVFAAGEPGARAAYVNDRELIASAICLIGILAAIAFNHYHARRVLNDPRKMTRWRRGLLAYGALVALALGASWMPTLPRTPFQVNIVYQAIHAFSGESDSSSGQYRAWSDAELLRRFREIANSPEGARSAEFWAREQHSNLIFFVLETTPYRCLPLAGALPNTPNIEAIRQQSFVGLDHNATYVFTGRNLLSIFTGWYPSSRRRESVERYPGSRLPGIVNALTDRGYKSASYAPVHDWFAIQEERLFRAFGFQNARYAAEFYSDGTREDLRESWRDKVQRDEEALGLMRKDIATWARSDNRFVTVFLPQIGHGPWPDISGKRNPDFGARCRLIVNLQDRWLGELIATLKAEQILDKSVIVVVGDHGVRNQREDPALPRVVIDDYSYHVPLLIYAPGTLKTSRLIPHPTSHVDISPTLFDLFGVERDRVFVQGLPLWDPNLASRRLFLLANSFSMTDAMVSQQKYTLCNYGTGAVYSADRLAFPESAMVRGAEAIDRQECQLITDFRGLQTAWLDRITQN